MEQETVTLLQKCGAGVKIAVNSLENALRKTKDPGLARALEHALSDHRVLNDSLRQQLAAQSAPVRRRRRMRWWRGLPRWSGTLSAA